MKCPACAARTEVESTRFGDTRTRCCTGCGHRFMTLETVVKTLAPAKASLRLLNLALGDVAGDVGGDRPTEDVGVCVAVELAKPQQD